MVEINNLKIFASYYYHNMGFNITHICPELNRIRDKKRGIFKNPYKSSTNDRSKLGVYRQYYSEIEDFNWTEAVGIGTVTGFNNLRALDFDCFEVDDKFIQVVLLLLKLPKDYEWVIKSGSGYGFHILFYSDHIEFADNARRMRTLYPNTFNEKKFENLDLVWYNHLILPPSLNKNGRQYFFCFKEYPLKKPFIVESEDISNLIFKLCYEHGGFNIIKQFRTRHYEIPINDSKIITDQSEYDKFINSENSKSNLAVTNQQIQYYKQNANSLDNVYKKEQYKIGLRKIVETIKAQLGNLSVLEIACGNGYWTKQISSFAKDVLATDINEECLKIAKSNTFPKSVSFEIQDAIDIKVTKKFDAVFGGFVVSHIEKEKLSQFFNSIHNAIKPNGKVLLIDNTSVPNNNMEIDYKSSNGDTFQKRIASDGKSYWVIKNFPEYNELKKAIENIAYDIEYTKLKYFWVLTYKIRK